MFERMAEIMIFDRIWIEHGEHPKRLLERSHAERRGLRQEFKTQFDRLNAQGHFVVLVPG
jgi:hypothetical protein